MNKAELPDFSKTQWRELKEVGYSIAISPRYLLSRNLTKEIKKAIKESEKKPNVFFWDDLISLPDKSGRPTLKRLRWPDDPHLLYQVEMTSRLAIRTELLTSLLNRNETSQSHLRSEFYGAFIKDRRHHLNDVFRFVGSPKDNAYAPLHRLEAPQVAKSISVILNYRDKSAMTIEAINSILSSKVSASVQIILVNNQSRSDERQKIEGFCRENIKNPFTYLHLEYPKEYNHSAQSNFAVQHATGEVLFFFNNDAILTLPETLQRLCDWCLTPQIASAGPRIIGQDNLLVSTGMCISIVDKPDLPFGAYIQETDCEALSLCVHTTCGNTFGCAAVSREVFDKVGPLDSQAFPTQFNDADFALKALSIGYQHLYIGDVEAYHQPGGSGGKTKDQIRETRRALCERYPVMQNFRYEGPSLSSLHYPLPFSPMGKLFLKALGAAGRFSRLSPQFSHQITAKIIRTRQKLSERMFPNF